MTEMDSAFLHLTSTAENVEILRQVRGITRAC
jgi:hypothetical protein